MKQRYWLLVTIILLAAGLAALFAVFDSAISLDYARAHNKNLAERCRLLAKLAEPQVLGLTESSIVPLVGPNVVVKAEGSDLRIDDLVFRTSGGIITEINVAESCH